jgi:hypothetical protein
VGVVACFRVVIGGWCDEDFTLPHRFQVIPNGIHIETWIPPGFQVEFLCRQPSQIIVQFHMESRWNPDEIQMDHVEHVEFHSLHLLDTDISVDSTWARVKYTLLTLPWAPFIISMLVECNESVLQISILPTYSVTWFVGRCFARQYEAYLF